MDFGVSSYLATQYAQFVQALDTLTTGGQETARAVAARQTPGDVAPRPIQVPGATRSRL